MAEGFKTLFAVIASHTASADTAESHVAGGQMNDGIVDAAAAEGHTAEEPLLHSLIPGEQVAGQRMGTAVDECNGFLNGIIGDYR